MVLRHLTARIGTGEYPAAFRFLLMSRTSFLKLPPDWLVRFKREVR